MPNSPEETVTKQGASETESPPIARDPFQPREGTVFKGKYRLEKKIGEGGMGVVFRALDLEAVKFNPDSSVVAIKLLKPDVSASPGAMAALFEEVEQTRKLQQENIVDVYAFEQDEHNAFMVMEFLIGRPLDRLIADEYALGMPFALAWPIINGMGQALAYAHKRGIIHSDFKPSNVFVTAAGTKVLDFGIARAARSPDIYDSGSEKLKGLTVAYASCDMLELMPPDMRDDVFAFGLVVYQLLTGRHPFDKIPATLARDRKAKVPTIRGLTRRQNAALDAALRFERFVRTPSIQEVLDEMWEGAKGPGRTPLWVVVGALLIILAGFGAKSAYQWLGPQDSDQQFVERLVSSGARAKESDPQTVRDLLEQGNAYLNDGQKPIDPGLLSENVSSALGAFQAVLVFDPENSAAAEGILAVVKAYKAEAQRLYGIGQFRRAEDMAKIGLRIWPDSVDLDKLESKIRRHLPPEEVKSRPKR